MILTMLTDSLETLTWSATAILKALRLKSVTVPATVYDCVLDTSRNSRAGGAEEQAAVTTEEETLEAEAAEVEEKMATARVVTMVVVLVADMAVALVQAVSLVEVRMAGQLEMAADATEVAQTAAEVSGVATVEVASVEVATVVESVAGLGAERVKVMRVEARSVAMQVGGIYGGDEGGEDGGDLGGGIRWR